MASRLGSPNRLGAAVKSNVIAVFDKIGGREKMAAWAEENLTEFYRLYARLIPTESTLDITFRDAADLSDSELVAIATGSSPGAAGPTQSEPKPPGVH